MKVVRLGGGCRECGDILVPVHHIGLWVCGWAKKAYMEYDCPHCEVHRQVPVCDHTVIQLFHHGVMVQVWEIPHEVEDPIRTTTLPHFTWDDLLDWHNALEQADYIIPVRIGAQRAQR